MINKGLLSISLVLICFLKRLHGGAKQLDFCIVQVPIYIYLLVLASNRNTCEINLFRRTTLTV